MAVMWNRVLLSPGILALGGSLGTPAFAPDAATAGWPAEPPGSRPRGKAGAAPFQVAALLGDRASSAPVEIDVVARCGEGEALIPVHNVGAAWPQVGTIAVYRLAGGERQLINKRMMRLADGQWASFKVKAPESGSDSLALHVALSWHGRGFAHDAAVRCP
jgi:hypothetical protein